MLLPPAQTEQMYNMRLLSLLAELAATGELIYVYFPSVEYCQVCISKSSLGYVFQQKLQHAEAPGSQVYILFNVYLF